MNRMSVYAWVLVCLLSAGLVKPAAQTSSPAATLALLNDLLKNYCATKPTLELSPGGVVVSKERDKATSTFKLADIERVGGMIGPDEARIFLSCKARASCVEHVQNGAKTTTATLSFSFSPGEHGRTAVKLFQDLLASVGGAKK